MICLKAKSRKLPHNDTRHKSIRLLELISSDIMGPTYPSEDEYRYVISFIDDYSNFTIIFTLKKRSEAAECFSQYHKKVTARFPGTNIVQLRCDNALEYVKGDLERFCRAAGIDTDPGQAYCPQQQGKAEQFNLTLSEKTRCLLLDSNLPKSLWPEAVKAASNLINRLPTKANPDNKTPYKMWHLRKPTVKYLRVFGCFAYAHIPKEVQQRTTDDQKFEERAQKLIHVGISANTGYRLYDPIKNKFVNSCDVEFVETKNFTDFKREKQIEDQNSLLDHDYAMDYAMTLVTNSHQVELDDFIPSTYDEALKCRFAL